MALLTHNQWASMVSGRYVDIDGSYGGQCWDTFADYCISVLGVPPINTWGGQWSGWAYAIWDQYGRNGAEKYFDQIPPHQPARQGDIPIWRVEPTYYPSSHIAVAEGDAGGSVYCMSQNSSPAQPWLPGYSTSATGPNVRQYLTKQGLAGYLRRKSHIVVLAPPAAIKPKEWDEMASKEDFKAAIREVLAEPAILDRIALAVLKRPCYLVDPTGKSGTIVGTTTLAKKINWMAHNDAQQLQAIVATNQGVEGIAVLLEQHTMVHEDGTPAADEDGVVPSADGLQPGAEFVTPSAQVQEEGK